MPSPADPHLTLDQAADALGTGPDFITQLLAAGHLDHTGHGDYLRIPESALIAYAVAVGDTATTPAHAAGGDLSAVPPPVPTVVPSAA
jgi:excisionase family DNA binding protein